MHKYEEFIDHECKFVVPVHSTDSYITLNCHVDNDDADDIDDNGIDDDELHRQRNGYILRTN